jgi:hypothetical protein
MPRREMLPRQIKAEFFSGALRQEQRPGVAKQFAREMRFTMITKIRLSKHKPAMVLQWIHRKHNRAGQAEVPCRPGELLGGPEDIIL